MLGQYARSLRATVAATRKDMKLTRAEIAERMAWKESRIENVEKGRRAISLQEFIVLSKEMGVDPEVMFRRVLRW